MNVLVRGARKLAAGMIAAALMAAPAAAQFSDSYNFLKAVRDGDGAKVTSALDRPGSTVVNTKDYDTGETALHIVVKRRDNTWLQFLLAKGAKADLRDNAGNTPLIVATQLGFSDGVRTLLSEGAAINGANSRGETPLIIAVQNRDAALVRLLLVNGGNPNLPDRIAGKSARDYAAEDRRSAAILKLIDETKSTKPSGKVAGPSL